MKSVIHAIPWRRWFLALLCLGLGLHTAAAKPPKKAPAAAPAQKVHAPPILEVVAHTQMKTTAEQQEAYAAALASATGYVLGSGATRFKIHSPPESPFLLTNFVGRGLPAAAKQIFRLSPSTEKIAAWWIGRPGSSSGSMSN